MTTSLPVAEKTLFPCSTETTVVAAIMSFNVDNSSALSGENVPGRGARIYEVLGRRIRSELVLPAPTVAGPGSDWELRVGSPEEESFSGHDIESLAPSGEDGGFLVRGFARVTVAGRRVELRPIGGAREADLRSVITGALTALLLARDGRLVLHGTALARDGRALVISGAAGAGKSTQSAYLACNGWRLYADDVAPVEWVAERPAVLPGYDTMRLFPDALRLIGVAPEGFPTVHGKTAKRLAMLGPARTEPGRPAALGGVVLLESGDSCTARRLSGREAVVALLNLMHPTAAMVVDASPTGRAEAFRACAALAQAVPVVAVRRAKVADNLARVAELVAAGLETV